jgi:hypothetical protein
MSPARTFAVAAMRLSTGPLPNSNPAVVGQVLMTKLKDQFVARPTLTGGELRFSAQNVTGTSVMSFTERDSPKRTLDIV